MNLYGIAAIYRFDTWSRTGRVHQPRHAISHVRGRA
jgi:hypothetical protein